MRISSFASILLVSCILLFMSFITNSYASNSLDLIGNETKIKMGQFLSYVEADSDLSIEQLLQNHRSIDWHANTRQSPSFYSTDQACWLKFKLNNLNDKSNEYFLAIDFPLLDEVEVYVVDPLANVSQQIGRSGLSQPVYERDIQHRSFVFPLMIEPETQVDIYLRIKNDGFTQLPITLWTPSTFYQLESLAIGLIAALLGVILAISVYSIFVYNAVKDKTFLYYSLYALCFFGFYVSLKGFGLQFFWDDQPNLSQSLFIVFMGFALAFLGLFNISFLKIQSHSYYAYRLFRILIFSCFSLILVPFIFPHIVGIVIGMSLALIISLSTLYVGYRAYQHKLEGSGRFLMSWICFAIGIFIIILNRSGVIDRTIFTEFGLVIGQIVSFVILFHALMGRIKLAQSQSVAAQDKAMSHYQMFHDIYQHAVEAHYTTTEDGRIVRGNQAFVDLLKFETIENLLSEQTNMAHFYLDVKDRQQLVRKAKELGRMIGYHAQWRRKDGRNIWVSINLRYQADTIDGNVLIGSIIDITESKKAEKQLEFMATHDALTGLYNRREFEKRLNDALFECNDEVSHTLLYMDLDQFKVVNDTCGHKAGDILLRQLTEEMRDIIEGKGTLARLGGDEFGVLLMDCTGDEAFVLAYQVKQSVQEFRFVWDSRVFTVGVSIGMVEVNEKIQSIDEVLSIADTACFTAKEQGRNRIHTYTELDKDVKRHHAEMEQVTQINKALEEDRFFLEFQIIMPIKVHEKLHYELLIRMQGENGERIPPGLFLPAAERYNLMAQIDQWVINHYFNWLSEHPDHMQNLSKCAINLSGPSLGNEDMRLYILNAFEQYKIPYNKICFEITESLAITQLDKTLGFIKTFRNLGCHFSLDDFGSGFSSYGYLKNLPVDYLKIDGAFVKDMLVDPIDCAMVKSINEVAKAIGMSTIAEFVESEEILLQLQEIGVDYAQGYFVNKPKPLAELLDISIPEIK